MLDIGKKICYRCKFRNVATDWGIEHEKPVKDCYFIQNSKNHSNFTIPESGLVINPKWSYGASPDSIVGCSCCGEHCLEIICPVHVRLHAVKLVGLSIKSSKQSMIVVILHPDLFLKHNGIDVCNSGHSGHIISGDIFTKRIFRTSKNVSAAVVLEIWNLSAKSITGIPNLNHIMHSINFSNGFNNFPFLIAGFTKLNNVIKVLKQAKPV